MLFLCVPTEASSSGGSALRTAGWAQQEGGSLRAEGMMQASQQEVVREDQKATISRTSTAGNVYTGLKLKSKKHFDGRGGAERPKRVLALHIKNDLFTGSLSFSAKTDLTK